MKLKDKNLYYVGGVVRDEILGIKSFDKDFCYEGNAIIFSQNLNKLRENPDFGTVRVLFNNEEIDIASTRTEKYPKPGHLPVVDKIGCSLKEDLQRRDFSIKAMAKNTVTGEITDFFDGLEDIENKKIRVLHDNSFIDDPSRILRGLKFAVRFGFELETHTKKLQDEYLNNINYDMSFHRIKKELKETFNLNNEKAFEIFISQNIYKLLGENQNTPQIKTSIQKLVEAHKPKNIWLVYAGLFNLEKLELNTEEQEIINSYNSIKNEFPRNDFEIYKLFSNLPLESILLYAISVDKNIATRFLDFLSEIKLETSGEDLIKLGFKQGKIFKHIFEKTLEYKINNPYITKSDEIEFIKENFL